MGCWKVNNVAAELVVIVVTGQSAKGGEVANRAGSITGM